MKKFLRTCLLFLCAAAVLGISAVGVFAQAPGRYDPAAEGIVSSYYYVDRDAGFLRGIEPGTTLQRLLNLCLPGGITASEETVNTGTTLSATAANAAGEQIALGLTAVVTGDLNGDGAITITDMLMIKTYILGGELEPIANAAGDINFDGGVTITDFLRSKAHLLELERIGAGKPAAAEGADESVLLLAGGTTLWETGLAAEGLASFVSDNEAVATVDPAGNITSPGAEGVSFVYALDAEGAVLDRVIVTVVSESPCVFLDRDTVRLFMGQSDTLTPRFNHPIDLEVSWESSDTAVVTVEGGTLTTQGPGTATVTASISNGSTDQVEVTVVPPIEDMYFEKSLYKVKPGSTIAPDLDVTPGDTGEAILWSSDDSDIAQVDADGVVTGVGYGTTTIRAKGQYSGEEAECEVKVCDVKQVAITFDDGPSQHTATLLDFLEDNELKATFFLVGNRLDAFAETAAREVAEGHEIGYHSMAHAEQTGLSSAQVTGDFNAANQKLKDLTGGEFTVWRAPGGGYSERVLQCISLPHIMWSVDTQDWSSRNTTSVYNAIMRASKDGSIILLHDLYSTSVEGAIKAMTEMQAGDYEFLTVTELLSRDGTPPEASTNYYSG